MHPMYNKSSGSGSGSCFFKMQKYIPNEPSQFHKIEENSIEEAQLTGKINL